MTWEQRLADATYTSPSGVVIAFDYEDVAKSVDKNTAAYSFPQVDGAIIQDLGHAGRKFPIRAFLSGADHDMAADEFEAALLERGAGILSHPLYGRRNVVPFGEISRKDNLKTAANQSIIEVVFWETILDSYPEQATGATVDDAVEAAKASIAGGYEAGTMATSSTQLAAQRAAHVRAVDAVARFFAPVVAAEQDVARKFNAIRSSILNGMGHLINTPAVLASQTVELLRAPGRLTGLVGARLSAYRSLIQSIISTPVSSTQEYLPAEAVALSAILAGAEAVAELPDNAVATADVLNELDAYLVDWDAVVAWREQNADPSNDEQYSGVFDLVATAERAAVSGAQTLKTERSIVLDRDRSIIDVGYELFGGGLDDLINLNDLSGSQILDLKKGTRIVHYV